MPESTMSVRDSLKFQNKCFPKDNSLKDSNLLSLRGNLQGKGYIYTSVKQYNTVHAEA